MGWWNSGVYIVLFRWWFRRVSSLGTLLFWSGGTNFGFMNGANDGHDHTEQYMPDVTSYGEESHTNMSASLAFMSLVCKCSGAPISGTCFPSCSNICTVLLYSQCCEHFLVHMAWHGAVSLPEPARQFLGGLAQKGLDNRNCTLCICIILHIMPF